MHRDVATIPHDWLAAFVAKVGRKPRVLHIGNIANNAYKNAKLLNAAGVDCDVICYDYYHMMGCPEWEDADFENAPRNQFQPDWAGASLRGFERPPWFVQGPFELCIDYLLARDAGRAETASLLWKGLSAYNRTRGGLLFIRVRAALSILRPYLRAPYLRAIMTSRDLWGKLWRKIRRNVPVRGPLGDAATHLAFALSAPAVWLLRAALRPRYMRDLAIPGKQVLYRSLSGASSAAGGQVLESVSAMQTWPGHVDRFVVLFASVFPERRDRLTKEDFLGYEGAIGRWQELLEHYDVVQAYATDPIIPMLAGKRPYVAFEHGTLRDFTLADNAVSRLNSLAYNQADHVFITNGDCLDYAKKIGVTRYTAMLHPIDEEMMRSARSESADLRAELGVRHVFLCTLRHDWLVKGTDKYIRALPGIAQAIGGDFMLLMTKWGAELEASMRLAKELGVYDKIKWIDPLPKRALARMQKSVDILFDQIALPHFGGTAPEGIAAGVPVIMSYDPNSTEWIIPEPAPILSAWTPEEIVERVRLALDPEWHAGYRVRAAEWFDRYHSSSVVVQRHLDVYAALLSPMIESGTMREAEKELR